MLAGAREALRGTPVSLAGAVGAALTSTAASICCIGPLGIAVLGVNGAILAAGLKPYRFYILSGSLALLAIAFWSRRRQRARAMACSTRAARLNRILLWSSAGLWVAALVIQFAADRYWL